jgi:hypothetical protein
MVQQTWGFRPLVTVFENVQPGAPERTFTVPDAAMPSARIAGRVLTPEGRPAGGVDVYLSLHQGDWPISDLPDPDLDGSFEIGPLPPGMYRFSVVSPNYVAADFGELTLVANQVPQVGEARLSHGARLEVRIRSTASEQVEGLTAEVLDGEGQRLGKGNLRGNQLDFRLLPPGSHTLSIAGPNVSPQLIVIELKAQKTLSLEITLR